jgi:hypothetical protein
MTFFAGLRGTGSFGTDERPKSFRESILWMNPNGSAPLFALTSKAKTESVNDPEFNWWEQTKNICRIQINGTVDNNPASTTIVVDSGALQLIPGDMLYVEPATEVATFNEERLRVVSVTNDTTFVVQRASSGSTIGTLTNDLWLFRYANAQSEGSLSPSSSSNNPTKYNNYTEIWKTPYTVTNTTLATKFRTGDPRKNEQIQKMFDHSEKIEQAMLFGRPYETVDASNGNMPLRFTMGLRHFIQSNRTVFTATPTEQGFIDAVYPVFNYNAGGAGNERIVMAGNVALNMLNMLASGGSSSRVRFDGTVKFYGMELQKWILPQGTLFIKSHPLMNIHPVYRSSMFIMPGSGLTWRPLSGRDTKLQKDIQPKDADYIKDQWITEGGFEFHHELTMAYLGQFRVF